MTQSNSLSTLFLAILVILAVAAAFQQCGLPRRQLHSATASTDTLPRAKAGAKALTSCFLSPSESTDPSSSHTSTPQINRRYNFHLFATDPTASTRINELMTENLYIPPRYLVDYVTRGMTDLPVSVADASAAGAVDLSTARADLMKLASQTSADMQVTDEGDILFIFPYDTLNILRRRSLGRRNRANCRASVPHRCVRL
jgi:hypothetical protein